MAIPKFEAFLSPFLYTLSDGNIHNSLEIKKILAAQLKLTDEELAMRLPSGTQTVFYSRTNWAGVYLRKAGLIESPSRSHYKITSAGLDAVRSKATINLSYLKQFPAFLEFHRSGKKPEQNGSDKSI